MIPLTEPQDNQLLLPLKGACVSQKVDIWNYSYCHDLFMRQEIIPQNWNENKQEAFSLGISPTFAQELSDPALAEQVSNLRQDI